MLCRIEAVLNSRPLIMLSNDPSDLQPLTPAHFLIMRNSFLVPVRDQTRIKVPLGKRWDNVTRMVQRFWDNVTRMEKKLLGSLVCGISGHSAASEKVVHL